MQIDGVMGILALVSVLFCLFVFIAMIEGE